MKLDDDIEYIIESENADGLILGSPNYLGDVSAGFRSLYERLIFQSLTYKNEPRSYNNKKIPVLMIMTSNADEEDYAQIGYDTMLKGYQQTLGAFVGNTKLLIAGNTKQVREYSQFDWSMFDTKEKDKRHETVFLEQLKEAYYTGEKMVKEPW